MPYSKVSLERLPDSLVMFQVGRLKSELRVMRDLIFSRLDVVVAVDVYVIYTRVERLGGG